MGGKSSTSTSTVSIPPEVLARYNAVNARAETAAKTPFQAYSQDPSAFVAQLSPTQRAGISGTNAAAGQAQPYYQAATGMTLAGSQGVNLEELETQRYMNPYVQSVVDPTIQALRQQQGQQLLQQQAQQIRGGGFGGDRSNLARGQLQGQQNLATAQAISPLYAQAYSQAQGVAQQQQAQRLAAQQANMVRLMQGGQQIAGLGTGAQAAGLQGAQAQLAAGAIEQQTEQAGKSALYNQYLQEQGYPFQVAQFLANIAEGTGALSGSTTSTTGPSSFFSDKNLKHDSEVIGKTFDGQPIYKYKYNGDNRTQIGLMAQDVENKHPDAVGESQGYKTVDYDKATKKSAERGHFYEGGLVNSQGGAVDPENFGEGFALGGTPYSEGYVPSSENKPQRKLMVAQPGAAAPGLGADLLQAASAIKGTKDLYSAGKEGLVGSAASKTAEATTGLAGKAGEFNKDGWLSSLTKPEMASGGRTGYADGGADDEEAPEGLYHTPGKGINIPDESNQRQLATAQNPTGSKGGGLGGDIKDAASMIGAGKTLASAGSWLAEAAPEALMFLLARGGVAGERHHRAEGGQIMEFSSDTSPVFEEEPKKEKLAGLIPAEKEMSTLVKEEPAGLVPPRPKENIPPDDMVAKTAHAIKRIESSGNYDAIGPETNRGDRAYGAYQVMGSNIPKWTEQVLGTRMTPEEFLANREAQDTVAHKKLAGYIAEHGTPHDAASMWFSGKPMAQAGNASDVTGTTVPDYIKRFAGVYGQEPVAQAPKKEAGVAGEKPSEGGVMGALEGIGDWYSRNERWLSPLAQGLGAMAASPSRYLGSAVLTGLGGAAAASQKQQLQQSVIAKNQFEMLKDSVNVTPTGAYNKYTGELIPAAELAKIMATIRGGAGSIPSSLKAQPTDGAPTQAPAATVAKINPEDVAKTAAAVTSATIAPSKTETDQYVMKDASELKQKLEKEYLASPETQKLPDLINPNVMLATAKKQSQQAELAYSRGFQAEGDKLTTQANALAIAAEAKIKEGISPVFNATSELLKKKMDTNLAVQQKILDAAQPASDRVQTAKQMIGELFDEKGNPTITTGGYSQQKADLAKKMVSLGFSENLINGLVMNSSIYDQVKKGVSPLAIEGVKSALGGDPVRIGEFNAFLQSGTPNPQEMGPRAIKWLLEHSVIPKAQQELDAAKFIGSLDPSVHDIYKAARDYPEKHPWYTPEEKAAPKEAAPMAGPKIGTVQSGYTFKGGNPAVKSNWEKVQ